MIDAWRRLPALVRLLLLIVACSVVGGLVWQALGAAAGTSTGGGLLLAGLRSAGRSGAARRSIRGHRREARADDAARRAEVEEIWSDVAAAARPAGEVSDAELDDVAERL